MKPSDLRLAYHITRALVASHLNCPLFRFTEEKNIICGLYRHLKGVAIAHAAVCILEVGHEDP